MSCFTTLRVNVCVCLWQVSTLWSALYDQGVSRQEKEALHRLLTDAAARGASGKVRGVYGVCSELCRLAFPWLQCNLCCAC